MSPNNNKLELTWVGKYDEQKPVEPRILIENPKYSYGTVETGVLPNGKPWNGNMLIHGDNLLALKALEQNFTNAVKCIYIDPPFNTGHAFEYYDVARKLIEQTTDSSMKGFVLSNTADACVQFKKDDKALKYYAEAVKNYEKSNAVEEIAENYKSAAQLMINFNSPNKAKSLLKKALVNAVKTKNEDLTSEINAMLASIE